MSLMRKLLLPVLAALLLSACSLSNNTQTPLTSNSYSTTPTPANSITINPSPTMTTKPATASATQVTLNTSLGDITIQLFPDKAPNTVTSFVGLATGTQEWIDPKTNQKKNTPLYNGTIFHRVIKEFMIQGGDPLGTGTGGPGYRFADEFSDLKFDEPYLLAMANSGPNTNGSQFFITVVPTPWLTNKHTIFGKVIKGQDVVDKIVNSPTGANDKPQTDIVIKQIVVDK